MGHVKVHHGTGFLKTQEHDTQGMKVSISYPQQPLNYQLTTMQLTLIFCRRDANV